MKILVFITSLLLPCLCWGQEMPLLVAHRGSSKAAPENTLPAFNLAWKRGADAIEGDFRLTRDGQIVCVHDKDTKRVAGTKLVVKQSTLAELKKLDVGVWQSNDWKGTRIPTLADVLKTVPAGKKVFIEVKCGVEIIPPLLIELKKSGLLDQQIVLICFDWKVIREFKKQRPKLKANWLSSFSKNEKGLLHPSASSVIETMKSCGADGFSSTKSLITKSFIKQVNDAGYEYHVWTIDEAKTAKRFKKWGVRSITTNVPGFIRKELNPTPGK